MKSSRQIEQDIQRTRSEMDETLDEFRERMKPRNLLDEALGMAQSYVRSGGDNGNGSGDSSGVGQHLAHGAKDAATHVSHALFDTVKRHPLPSLLIGAGAAWLVYESTQNRSWPDWEHMGENSPQGYRRSSRPRSYDGDFDRSYGGGTMSREQELYYGGPSSASQGSSFATQPMPTQTEPAIFAAWHEDYDWTDEDERAWSQNAYTSIAEIETTLNDESRPARERMRSVAGHLQNLSGSKYQSKWREWKERAGSSVDARTGEPYTDDYGYGEAAGLEYLLGSQSEERPDADKHAEGIIAKMREALSKGGRSVRRRVADLASHSADYAGTVSGRGYRGAKSAMRRAGSGMASAGRQTGHAVADAGRWVGQGAYEGARMGGQGAMSAGRQVRRSAVATRRSVGNAMDEYPLAAAGAFLGLGLLAGLLVPETDQENRLMGETSDRMKRQAYEAGKDAVQRAGHVAQETARAAQEEAERQGIAPSQIADKASQAAKKASQGVAEAAGAAKETAPAAGSTIVDKLEQVAKTAAQTAKSEIKQEAKQSKAANLMNENKNA
ncbi:MAG TPA: DUF3618 domain-containing protein [Pirellulaceae bacterium]|jgi:hypothetical protein|nr:DUF3618 domain-containing protein [Pirellulaceae bacterium]